MRPRRRESGPTREHLVICRRLITLVTASARVNDAKKDLTEEEFVEVCRQVVAWSERRR
jgi:hypothetical protein